MIGFPRTINEKAARVVAAVVAVTALVALLTPARWLVVPLAYGFARVLTGPRTTAAAVALALGATTVVDGLLAALVVAATLESVVAFCVGCQIFGLLMRAGVIPDAVCAECANIWART